MEGKSLKVRKLKEYLNNLPKEMDDCEIILQKDAEGNGYGELRGIAEAIAIKDRRGYGYDNIYDLDWTADECCLEEDEWEKLKKEKPSFILYP